MDERGAGWDKAAAGGNVPGPKCGGVAGASAAGRRLLAGGDRGLAACSGRQASDARCCTGPTRPFGVGFEVPAFIREAIRWHAHLRALISNRHAQLSCTASCTG